MKSSTLLIQAVLAASGAYAQEVLAEVLVYNANDCAENPNNPDLISSKITVFKDVSEIKVVDGQANGACMKTMWEVPGWPTTNQGLYDLHVDENTVPDSCELVVYKDVPAGSGTSGQNICTTFYRRVPSNGLCTTLTVGKEFGYAMCCGEESCSFAARNNPFGGSPKRNALPEPVKDVSAVKKSPLMRRQAGCKFNPDNGATKTTIEYGDQTIISNTRDCPGTESCKIKFGISYSVSVTNTFGVEASIGGDLFKAISASISFTYEYSTEKTTEWNEDYEETVPAGASGYLTFQPQLECSPPGTFESENCNDAIKGKAGRACFPTYNGEKPYGSIIFVQTN